MAEKTRLSLVIWQGTEDYRQEYSQAKQRFQDISGRLYDKGFKCTYLGDLRMDSDGYPEVWLNDNMPLSANRNCTTPEVAIKYASQHGRCGWWSLDELEQFVNNKGPIFESAIWNLGYRRAKKDPSKWAKKTKNDQGPKYGQAKQIDEITGEELERLNRLWVMPNESAGVSKTYLINTGKRGMIHVYLWANPFAGHTAETMWILGAESRNRGHIAKQQDGFYIDARNVKLDKQEGIHIKAIKPDTNYIECIWPIQIPMEKICDLSNDLVSRVK